MTVTSERDTITKKETNRVETQVIFQAGPQHPSLIVSSRGRARDEAASSPGEK